MDYRRARVIQDVINHLQTIQIALSEIVIYALQQYHDPSHPVLNDFVLNGTGIAAAMLYQDATEAKITKWATDLARVKFSKAAKALARRENGWHFDAAQTHPDQLRDFRLEDMAVAMHRKAPELWALVRSLLGYEADELPPVGSLAEVDEHDPDAEYWSIVDGAARTGESDTRLKRAKLVNIVSAVRMCQIVY